jgi:hypothetical protein
VDDVLSTTRAVRKRLDFDRDVEPELITECVRLAQQAPSVTPELLSRARSGRTRWHWSPGCGQRVVLVTCSPASSRATARAARSRRQLLTARLVATFLTQASGESHRLTEAHRCQALANASCAMSCASARLPVSA